MTEKLNIKALLCCRACAPLRGSEPGLGWNVACAAASFCTVHVLVCSDFKPSIEQYYEAHPEQRGDIIFHYVDLLPYTFRFERRLQEKFPSLYYYYEYVRWQKQAARCAQELDAQEHFDIVHQVTLAGYRMPGFMHRLKKPLLWGPVGGFCNAPYRLLPMMKVKDILFFSLRNLVNSWQMYCGYAARTFSKAADYILVSTRDGEKLVKNHWKRPSEYMCEIGTNADVKPETLPIVRQPGEPLKLCWAGIMNNGRKNLPLLFQALRYCSFPVELHVFGDGAYRPVWEACAQKVPAPHRVIFHGRVAQGQLHEQMKRSHIFCITSIKDDTSSVLLEALQFGVPVVAPDSCGFAAVITPECGRKVAISLPAAFAKAYGAELQALGEDELMRQKLSQGAFLRSLDFSWEAKTRRLKEIYRTLVERSRRVSHSD